MYARLLNRRWSSTAAVTVAVAALLLGAARIAAADTTVFTDDFEDGNANGWSKSGGSWSVVTDGSRALRQTSATTGDARAYAGSAWADVTAEARLRPVERAADGFVALAVRQQSSTNAYRFALYTDGRAQLEAVRNGTVTVIGAGTHTAATGAWTAVRVEAAGTTLRGYVGGALVAQGTATAFASGKVGVWTYHAAASFDDVRVAGSAGTPPSSPGPSSSGPGTPPGNPPAGQVGYATLAGGTTGGAGGPTVTVSTWADLVTEVGRHTPQTVQVNGILQGSGQATVRGDKTIVGLGANSGINGGGLKISHYNNVIIRNLKLSNPVGTDAITVQDADHVWIDHNELWSDRAHDIDYYDGLIDITHASDWVTVSWNKIHDHWKTSLVSHDDDNAAEDVGHLTVTYHHNELYNADARLPSIRFGTAHVFNNYYHDDNNGVHSRMGAQVLVEGNVFVNVATPVKTTTLSVQDGYAVERGNVYTGCGPNLITQVGSFTSPPYPYTLESTSTVAASVTANAGTGRV
ncbi:polysaccharide lyase family 1 protein [Dactylosporangium aurantiacum]|uniref:Polysaccharide lyase family 1 protein n=1 Tax=Dactylosporangium aurantiacum TaxID=35754 RepID=A0A9Q9MGR1_9ACTN|nr:polysaccharide lyase family 1 protein [Dactylosporangium aurantiacum]MDG6103597.1 polysaccharide lyase family 1 protein [Dactylosporangium aurantiacum]UWZ51911.1 polysaccharide lyase family 1 protein [Dactylosporangium aurantiacum]